MSFRTFLLCLLLPLAAASAHAEVDAPACGGPVNGTATCTFICASGPSFTVVSFSGAGTVSATCMGLPAASCATGTAGVCTDHAYTPSNGQGIGLCTAQGVGAFTCSLAYELPDSP